MTAAIFYPDREGDIAPYSSNIVTRLTENGGALATALDVNAATLAQIGGYATDIPTKINEAEAAENAAKGVVAAKKAAIKSAKDNMLNTIQLWTRHPNWTYEIGRALGVYIERVPVDLANVKPRITDVEVHPDMVILDWVRGRMDGVSVYGSYDGTNFQLIDKDTKSPYEDTRNNRIQGAEWRFYKLRYQKNDKEVGLFSDIVNALVSIGSGGVTPPKP
jgi:hypothetical protein